jgi:hypothetical protein
MHAAYPFDVNLVDFITVVIIKEGYYKFFNV